jgi:hypothetical protein
MIDLAMRKGSDLRGGAHVPARPWSRHSSWGPWLAVICVALGTLLVASPASAVASADSGIGLATASAVVESTPSAGVTITPITMTGTFPFAGLPAAGQLTLSSMSFPWVWCPESPNPPFAPQCAVSPSFSGNVIPQGAVSGSCQGLVEIPTGIAADWASWQIVLACSGLTVSAEQVNLSLTIDGQGSFNSPFVGTYSAS